jgi:hypothetical protein
VTGNPSVHFRLRRRSLSWLFTGTLVAAGWFSARPASAGPPAAQPVCTSRAKFRIPFQFDAEEMTRLGAIEIQLFVSTDQGRHWQHAQSVAPAAGRFTFEAPGEGEYRFSVRTVDGQNQFHPPGPLQSGLQVIVDQTPPTLQIQLRESSPGEVELAWNAADDNLNVDSLRLEYQDGNTRNWQPVGIMPAGSGRTTWNVPQGGRVLVRGTVADLAGNEISADAATSLQAARPGQPRPATPDFSQPVAGPRTLPQAPGSIAANPSVTTAPNAMPDVLMPVIQPIPVAGAGPPRIVAGPAPDQSTAAQTDDATARTNSPRATGRRINVARFNLNYSVDEVGPSGLGGIDLYITEDNGGKWYLYGPDEDRRSPMPVEVPRDGVYGFAVRARSGVGLAQDAPQPGEPPAMRIIVDRQPPQAALKSVRQGVGAAHHQVEIVWEVTDEELAELPVALYYSGQPGGPWQSITGWRENDGLFRWTINTDMPSQLYVRLVARDAAGNMARVEAAEPLYVDLTRPAARIVDIESLQSGPQPQ